jgi:iron(III) transport system substrate-binding protein
MQYSKKIIKFSAIGAALTLGMALLSGCSSSKEEASGITELTVYSGRSEEYIAPFFAEWEANSGIKLNIRYGDSAELAAQILEEGKNSPADLFLSQDAGSLGAVADADLFTSLPKDVAEQIPATFVAANRKWVGVTGRARVFAYSPSLKTLPKGVADLTSSAYKGILGIAPSNSSFQAFVTALINEKGAAAAEAWLKDLSDNDVKIYAKNSAIVEAIDKGEIKIGLVNHYYVWEVSESLGREVNAKIGFFSAGDIGNLINVSGAGVLASSKKISAAEDLINFLTSNQVQEEFVSKTHEYSLLEGASAPEDLPSLPDIGAPTIDLEALKNVKRTQELLVKVGLL